jgi:hypothetical protein
MFARMICGACTLDVAAGAGCSRRRSLGSIGRAMRRVTIPHQHVGVKDDPLAPQIACHIIFAQISGL